MKNIKKIITSIIIAIIGIFGIYTTANAYSVGQYIEVSYSNYENSSNIYCVEHGQSLKGVVGYKIISNVKIEGSNSTDHKGKTISSKDNAKLAYILSADNGKVKDQGPVSNGIWNFMYTWMQNVGQHHAGLYNGFASNKKGNSTWIDSESSNYANSIGDMKITDNTNKDKIKVVAYNKDNKQYMRVGPFNWSFTGTMTGISANDQNGKSIGGLLYSSFNGNKEYWYSADKLKSGRDFYISVPMSTDITKITKVTGIAKMKVKGVNIWFLEATTGYMQNLIIREPYDTSKDVETSFKYDISVLGSLNVIKVNKDNEKVKLKGVGFIIQHKNTGKYVHKDSAGKITYVDKKDATEFVTDDKGKILIKNLVVGTYVAYETKNPNYGYEIISDGQEKYVEVDKTNDFVIGNKQVYVKLSGYVWVDKIFGKQSIRNDIFKDNDYDINDILLDGITVRLKDRTTGNTIKEAKTAEGGSYLFTDVLIEKLSDYYIEFEYDGLTYTNVVPHIDKDNGSKSAESEKVRDDFNKNFSKVEGRDRNTGYTRDANGNIKHNLSYNVSETEHKSTLINNGQYTITANTDEPKYIIKDHFTYGQEEIKYINLGLYEREQPDIAIVKDLENVRLTVNGYEHTYQYAQRFVNQGEYGDGFNVGVKFGEKYGNMSYSRAIYKADYEYINEKDKSKELKAYITYKIGIRNKSTNLTVQVNDIVDYYDSKYTLVNVGNELDQKGNIVKEITHDDSNYSSEYAKTIIHNNTKIESQSEASIYVQFELNREAVVNILNDRENLNNVTEISSYSVFDKETQKIYAGIDKNSNPGNSVPGDVKTYEDDTDSSPALKLEVANAREIAGKVFVDTTTGELKTGEVRQGSGAYEEGETGIEGVDITLTENTGSGKVYTAKTDTEGNFLVSDYIPGDYTLTYTWGDQTYTVQNYKGTIYDSSRDQNNKNWYKENVDTRLTDALDNYNVDQDAPKGSREQIDAEMKTVDKDTYNSFTRTKMDSTTPTMGIGVEYETTYTASTGDRYTYRINNLDFGIVERARQQMDLTKRISKMKVTLANGQLIVDLTIDENGNITGEKNHITYMGPSKDIEPKNGFIKLELDNELIQGATVEVEYEIKAINNSELDYLSEKFYKYGTVEGEVVTITPSAVIDYLDKDWAFDQEKNQQWTVKTLDEIKDIVAETVYNNEETTIEQKTILYTESLKDKKLQPKQTGSVMLNVSKILTTTEDISLGNETEIINIEKPGGSKTTSTPGNYIPGTGKTEPDDDIAETVIVTPSTGQDQNYIIPIIVGVTALLILGVGVVIIKKKALK